MGKACIAISLQIFGHKFYRNVPSVVRKLKLEKQYSEIISSEAIRGIKLKRCRNVHNISLYKNVFFFIAVAHVLSLSFYRLIMGKVKTGIYCYLIAGILTEIFRNVC